MIEAKILQGVKRYKAIDVVILSGILDVLLILGVYLQEQTHDKIFYILYSIFAFIMLDVIIATIFNYIDGCSIFERSSLAIYGKNISFKQLNIFLFFIIILCWLPYIIMCFPGNVCYDSGTSILYYLNIYRENTNNPPFQNVIFGIVYVLGVKFGNINIAIFLYCIIQLLFYAGIISYGLKLLVEKGIPLKIIICVAILYCICPIFPIYAYTMGKDSNFALVFFAFNIMLFKIIDKKSIISRRQTIFFVFIAVVLGLLRNATYLIVVVTLVLLMLVRRKNISNILIGLTIVLTIIVNVFIPKVLEIPSASKGDALSVPLQQTAYYMKKNKGQVSAEERKAIEDILPGVDFNEYNPDISDPIKAYFNQNASWDELREYFDTWAVQLTKDPKAYLKATILGTYAYYSPTADKSDVKTHAIVGIGVSEKVINETQIQLNNNVSLHYAKALDNEFKEIPIIGLFSKIGIYSWMVFISVAYLLSRRKMHQLICTIPLLLIFGMCLLSPVNGYFRYAFNMILSIPVILPLVVFMAKKIKA